MLLLYAQHLQLNLSVASSTLKLKLCPKAVMVILVLAFVMQTHPWTNFQVKHLRLFDRTTSEGVSLM